MMNPVRQEVKRVVAELSEQWPQMRFGQLIANMATVARGLDDGVIWDMEDEELLEAVKWQLAELRERRGSEVA